MAKKAKKKATKAKVTKKKTTTKSASARSAKSTSRTTRSASSATKKSTGVKGRTCIPPKNRGTGSYTQSEFYENIKNFCGLEKRSEAKTLCEDIAIFLRESLKKGFKVPLMGLGKMYVRQTKARMGRNPRTGEMMQIPARRKVRFTPAKAFKEAVL